MMKTNSKIVLAAAAAAVVAAPAFAADVVYQEPVAAPAPIFEPAPISSWEGPYAGLQFGYGFSGRVRDRDGGDHIGTKGWLGGAFAGYNFQNGGFVYGLEGDINYSDVKGSISDGVDTIHARTRFDGSIRARAGVAVSDDVLIYATAGGAAEQLRLSSATDRDTNTMLGYTVGAGTDIKLTDQVFARGEYRFTDYGSKTFTLDGVSGSIDSRNHRVTVGLGVKF